MIAAMLLVAAVAATPANAQDAVGEVPVYAAEPAPPPSGEPPTNEPPATPTDPGSGTIPNDPPPPPPPADTPSTPPSEPPASEGSNEPPAQTPPDSGSATGAGDHRQPVQDEFVSATAGPGGSATSPTSTSTPSDRSDFQGGGPGDDTWLGQDTFVLSETAVPDDETGPVMRAHFGGLLLAGVASPEKGIEAHARQNHEIAQVSAIGSGPPGPGNQLPGKNPFFNLLSGPGGIGTSLMLAGLLAVLGAAFLLPSDRLRAFRMPTVTWSPLAYVPPIELPG